MKCYLLRSILTILPVIVLILVSNSPVYAISAPDTITISNVYAYRNVLEDNDQLYIVYYDLGYSSPPTEDAADAFLFLFMDGTDILAGPVVPYAYESDGYVDGVVSFYFSASDAPTWESSYQVKMQGNPYLSWSGDVPETSIGSFSVWQDNATEVQNILISDRIIWLAEQLDDDWGASYSLLTNYSVGDYLSTYGIDYFTHTITDIATIAPLCLADRTILPDVKDTEYTQDYQNDLITDITSSPFDMSGLGTILGISGTMVTSIVYYIVAFILVMLSCQQMKTNKHATLLLGLLSIMGVFFGVPLVVVIIVTFLCLVLTGYVLFYRPSGV